MTDPSQRLLVVLDLDETLIFGDREIPKESADFHSGPYQCLVRPHARALIDECLDRYDVAVWTSAGEGHAMSVVGALFPKPETLAFVWSAAKCTDRHDPATFETFSIKDLRKVRRAGYSLERTIAIDDSPEKHVRNFGNLLRVTPWTGQTDDNELLDVAAYLRWLDQHDNVRVVEKRGWRNNSRWREDTAPASGEDRAIVGDRSG